MTDEPTAGVLKACPFCGGDAGPEEGSIASLGAAHTVTIYCNVCHASSGTELSFEDAAKAWNTRTPSPDLLAELAGALENCRKTFAEYAELHRGKLTTPKPASDHRQLLRKIARNRDMTDLCVAALARWKEQGGG